MIALLAAALALTSPDVVAGGRIGAAQVWNRDGCHGGNVSPALRWSGVPHGTRSLVLELFDSDAPTGHGWYHWTAWDIPADRRGLDRGRVPAFVVQGRNEYGFLGYGGPCPPPGPAHHYLFILYALPVAHLGLPAGAGWQQFMLTVNRQHPIGRAALLEARYGR